MQSDLHEDGMKNQTLNADAAFYHEMGEELYKKTIPFLNDVLGKLLTISVTLSGGTVFFLGDRTYPNGMRIVVVFMFLLAFIMAFMGIIPYRVSIRYCCPDEVRETVTSAIWWKDGYIWGSSIFIVLGIILAAVGFLVGTPPQ